MKGQLFLTTALITLAGFAAIQFSDQPETKDKAIIPTEKVSQELNTKLLPWDLASYRTITGKDETFYQIRPKNWRGIGKEKLNAANSLEDIIPHYPSSWISNYQEVTISSIWGKEVSKATSKNQMLSEAQKRLIADAAYASDLNIVVDFKEKNPLSGEFEDRQMKTQLTLVPPVEAKFMGDKDEMIQGIKTEMESWLAGKGYVWEESGVVRFMINEQGEVHQVTLANSTSYPEVDEMLLSVIKKLPKWEAAIDENGQATNQLFEFTFGKPGC